MGSLSFHGIHDFKYLGSHLHPDLNTWEKNNYAEVFDEMKSDLSRWSKASLFISGETKCHLNENLPEISLFLNLLPVSPGIMLPSGRPRDSGSGESISEVIVSRDGRNLSPPLFLRTLLWLSSFGLKQCSNVCVCNGCFPGSISDPVPCAGNSMGECQPPGLHWPGSTLQC